MERPLEGSDLNAEGPPPWPSAFCFSGLWFSRYYRDVTRELRKELLEMMRWILSDKRQGPFSATVRRMK